MYEGQFVYCKPVARKGSIIRIHENSEYTVRLMKEPGRYPEQERRFLEDELRAE